MYEISTIGRLGDAAAPVVNPPPPIQAPSSVAAPQIVLVAIGAALLGAITLWAWEKYA
jgi:hypothetical protein